MKYCNTSIVAMAAVAAGIAFSAPAAAGGTHGGAKGHGYSFGAPGHAQDVTRTVRVEAGDMVFRVESLAIEEGETIRFVVTNTDEIDHDFTIGPPDLQAQHRAEMMKMMEGEHGMAAMHHEPKAVYLAPGETRELIWSFRNVAELEYACNVPGHYEAGMKGQFRTKR
jgi:uncharacterized cupredoxin-like copper-binding protein